MGGVAKAIGQVASVVTKIDNTPMNAVVRNLPKFITGDKGLGHIATESQQFMSGSERAANALAAGKSPTESGRDMIDPVISNIKKSVNLIQGKSDAPPASIVAADPVAIEAQNKAQRAAAARQSQIDNQTQSPGRGGTILTNNYRYNI